MGVTYDDLHADRAAAHSEIVSRFHELSRSYDALVVLGSDYTDVSTQSELQFNAQIAANLGAPVVLVISGAGRTPVQIRTAADQARFELGTEHAQAIAVVANRVEPADLEATRAALGVACELPVGAIPEVPLLVAPTVRALLEACGGELIRGNPEWLDRESLGFVVAAMSLPNVLTRLHEDVTVIAPGDRADLLPGLLLAHQSGTFPHLSAIVLTGGYQPPDPIRKLISGVLQELPIIVTELRHVRDRCAAVHRARPAVGRVAGEGGDRPAGVRRIGGRAGPAGRDGRRRGAGDHPADVPVPADRTGQDRAAGGSSSRRAATSASCGRRRRCSGSASPI